MVIGIHPFVIGTPDGAAALQRERRDGEIGRRGAVEQGRHDPGRYEGERDQRSSVCRMHALPDREVLPLCTRMTTSCSGATSPIARIRLVARYLELTAHNRLVGGSSPPGSTTHSFERGDFPTADE